MTKEQRYWTESKVRFFMNLISSDHHFVNSMTDAILDDVIDDIECSADIDFNLDDVQIAIARVLMKKFGID